MIEKLNLREVENGAHGAQSTVVEGASLSTGKAGRAYSGDAALISFSFIYLHSTVEMRPNPISHFYFIFY